jgi:3-keto-disaccharide hydrolase
MIRILTILGIAFLIIDVSAAEPNTLTEGEKAEGWRLLFDGKTTKGWVAIGKTEFPAKGWTIIDGALHHEKGGGGGDIVTAEHFENFELAWEWKIGAVGNSGLKYNLVDPNKAVGFEYQMIDDENHPDGIRGGRLHQTAALYDLLEPAANAKAHPVGEWNQSRVVLRGNHVEQWLNGAKTVEVELGSEALKAAIAKSKFKSVPNFGVKTKSPILLQDHGDEVSVRNIKIRALPAS